MMRVEELRAELHGRRVPRTVYCIGGEQNESHCIVEEHGSWHVFYSERGCRNSEEVFSQEPAACQEFLSRILGDGAIVAWMER